MTMHNLTIWIIDVAVWFQDPVHNGIAAWILVGVVFPAALLMHSFYKGEGK